MAGPVVRAPGSRHGKRHGKNDLPTGACSTCIILSRKVPYLPGIAVVTDGVANPSERERLLRTGRLLRPKIVHAGAPR